MAVYARPFVADTIKDLNAVARQHLPFVLAKTLTQTAKGAAERVKMKTRREFNLHGEFIPRGIRFKSANKSDLVRFGFIESDVHTAPLISQFMPIHEMGGVRSPFPKGARDRGAALALPGVDLRRRGGFKTRTGRIKKIWKPEELLKHYNAQGSKGGKQPRTGGGARRKAFIIKSRRGQAMIVRRRGKGSYGLERLFLFTPRAKIKPVWDFEPTVRRFVAFAIVKKFERNMREAIVG